MKLKNQIFEDTSTPAAPGVATTDEILSVDEIFQQSLLPSLGRQIFPILPLHGPTGAIFNIRKKSASNELELVRSDVEVYNSTSISTNITQEAIQDIRSQYGKEANIIIGNLLRGLANEQENTAVMAFLSAQSLADSALQLTDSLNAETNFFEITQRVHELVLKINSLNLRSYQAFAVIPYQPLGGIMGLKSYVQGDKMNERGLFITRIGQTDFYLNPDVTDDNVYVGIHDHDDPNKCSGVFSPYVSKIIDAINPDSGENAFFIYNRFAVTASPLHVTDNEMFHKFQILL